jgi:hypothetical protein
MQTTFFSNLSLFAKTAVNTGAATTESRPVELDIAVLGEVGGGLGPNGTWVVAATSTGSNEGPNGTW